MSSIRKPTDRTVAAGFLGALLLAALATACEREAAQAASTDTVAIPVPVQVHVVEPESVDAKRRFAGYAHPWEAHGVGFLVAGRVTSVEVDAGDRVVEGQLLATLEPDDYKLMEKLARVQVKALQPNVKRVQELVEKEALPETQLDEIQGKYDAARTQRRQAARQVAHTTLESPCEGVVMSRETSVGQVIGAGMPAVVILDLERLKVKFGVTQTDLAAFHVGDEVPVTFPGIEGRRTGRIHNIGFVPDPKARTYEIVVALDNPGLQLRPGLLAHTEVVVDRAAGIFVPLDTVRNDDADGRFVLLHDPETGTALRRKVELGRIWGKRAQIASGLSAGDRLIVKGQMHVRDGDRVEVR